MIRNEAMSGFTSVIGICAQNDDHLLLQLPAFMADPSTETGKGAIALSTSCATAGGELMGVLDSIQRFERAHPSSEVHIFEGAVLVYVNFTNFGSYACKFLHFVCFQRFASKSHCIRKESKVVICVFRLRRNLQIRFYVTTNDQCALSPEKYQETHQEMRERT